MKTYRIIYSNMPLLNIFPIVNLHKVSLIFFLLLVAHPILSQENGDEYNIRFLDTYKNDVEVARVSITFEHNFNTVNQNDFLAYIDPNLPMNGGNPVSDGSFNKNYIRLFEPLSNNATNIDPSHENLDYNNWSEKIVYFDGLGREIQSINVKASGYSNDIINPVIYNDFGMKKREYLTYALNQDASSNNPGGYRSNPVEELQDFYSNYFGDDDGSLAYYENMYDESPNNIVLEKSSPGSGFELNSDHSVTYRYLLNSNYITRFYVEGDGVLIKGVNDQNNQYKNYKPNTLYKNIIIDENGNRNVEYKDKSDKIILKEGEENTKTYYVYDDFGLLRFVIPPKASEIIDNMNGAIGDITAPVIRTLCYYYKYNENKLNVLKKVPGADPIYLIYNKRNQLVLTQDGNQRLSNLWSFTKYDAFNRPIITGIHDFGSLISLEGMQGYVNNASEKYFEEFISGVGYSNETYPELDNNDIIYSIQYYDNYEAKSLYNSENNGSGKYNFDENEIDFLHLVNNQESSNVKGLPTISWTKVLLNGDTITDDELVSVIYYNTNEQPVQIISDNHLGGYDVVSHRVNFTGDIIQSKEKHFNGDNIIEIYQRFEYDNDKRLVKEIHKLPNTDSVILLQQAYNEMSLLKEKKLNGGLQKINYFYDIRKWLTQINRINNVDETLFAMEINYRSAINPQYNGNIGSISWATSKFPDLKTYNFSYDGLNRLKIANYLDLGLYSASYDYDANGNIETLTRYMDVNNNAELIDSLSFEYNGNQLKFVNDALGANFENYGFKDNGSYVPLEYDFDKNGNMIWDLNKGISEIFYSDLNKPLKINFSNNNKENVSIEYIYSADGLKLRKNTKDGSKNSTNVDYIGKFVYSESVLQFIISTEGRIVPNENGGFDYEYYIKDHLDNIRVMFNESGEILQDKNYYPFGLDMGEKLSYNMSDNSPDNLYLYNSKELQIDYNLNWYSYGARLYDPQIVRFIGIDPIADKFSQISPYNYADNDPISNIDLHGLQSFNYKGLRWAMYSKAVKNTIGYDMRFSNSTTYNITYAKTLLSATKNEIIATGKYVSDSPLLMMLSALSAGPVAAEAIPLYSQYLISATNSTVPHVARGILGISEKTGMALDYLGGFLVSNQQIASAVLEGLITAALPAGEMSGVNPIPGVGNINELTKILIQTYSLGKEYSGEYNELLKEIAEILESFLNFETFAQDAASKYYFPVRDNTNLLNDYVNPYDYTKRR